MSRKLTTKKQIGVGLVVLMLMALCSCAVLQPADVNGPRTNLPAYPIVASDPANFETTSVAWHQLAQRYALPQGSIADFQPVTGTIRSVPSNLGGSIFLPKVSAAQTPTEEDTRESLRRFIMEWKGLIGADPHQLSLVERTDSGTLKTARYEQRPFRYPLRGPFGSLIIRFQADRRVIDISSTCIPDADHLQGALTALTPAITGEEAATLVNQASLTINTDSAKQGAITLPPTASVDVRQLVAYAQLSQDQQKVELHLAWEIDVTNGPIKTIYLDAISKKVLAVE
ncbi:MAG TPA: hypothetical protein VLE19_01765 [Pyrinomonadaceae bacterium]|nr:hypothetical protein [Pyrinomonadaceae bacterium]